MKPLRSSLAVTTLVVPGVVALAVAVAVAVMWSAIPEQVVVHWDPDGSTDAFTSRTRSFLFLGILYAVIWGSFLWAARGGIDQRRIFGAHYAAMSVYVVLVGAHIVLNTMAGPADRTVLGFVALFGVAAARYGMKLGERIAPTDRTAVRPVEAVSFVAPGERAFWYGSARSKVALGVAVVVAAALPLWMGLSIGTLLRGSGLIVVVALWNRTQMWITPEHIKVRWGPFGICRQTYSMDRVEGAAVQTVGPFGYGVFASRTLEDAHAYVARGGEAVRFTVAGEKEDIVVTVDGAEEAAQLINNLVAARKRARPAAPNPA